MSDKITITFPDGNFRSVKKGINGFEIAEEISKSLAKESIAIKINSEIFDLKRKIPKKQKSKIFIFVIKFPKIKLIGKRPRIMLVNCV